jgi:hypothetical protein
MPDFIKHGDFNKFILIVYFLDGHSPHTLWFGFLATWLVESKIIGQYNMY